MKPKCAARPTPVCLPRALGGRYGRQALNFPVKFLDITALLASTRSAYLFQRSGRLTRTLRELQSSQVKYSHSPAIASRRVIYLHPPELPRRPRPRQSLIQSIMECKELGPDARILGYNLCKLTAILHLHRDCRVHQHNNLKLTLYRWLPVLAVGLFPHQQV